MKKVLLFISLLTTTYLAYSQCSGLQIIGFNSDNPDQILLQATSDIAASTVFYITDNEWNGTSFNTGETTFQWTAPVGGVASGSTILLQGTTATCGTVTGTPTLATDGEEIYITSVSPVGTVSASNICFAVLFGGTGTISGITSVDVGNFDNASYSGSNAITNASNWTTNNNIIILPTANCNTIAVSNPTVQFTAATYSVNENAGTVNATVCVAITSPNATATSVDVALTGGTATNGTDISTYSTQTLTFPASSSVDQCISFTLTDDALFEGTETLIFTLQNQTNSATIGTNGTATVSILDSDLPQIIITEIMIDPCSGGSGFFANEGDGEYVEIYNAESSAVNIGGYVLEDEEGMSDFFTFPANTSLPAGGFAVVANTTLYDLLDTDANNTIDVGQPGAGSLIFDKGSANELDNTGADGLELTDASNNLLDKVDWNQPSCLTSNDGFSAVLLAPYTADNSNINTANWFPSLDGGNGTAGGGTPGAANTAGACIGTVTATATGVSCGSSSASLTVGVQFVVTNSAVSQYDIYKDGVFFATYNAGTTASATYTYTTPNLAPTTATSINFEVRPTTATTNSCYSADDDATIISCLLPVELTTFTATTINETIALAWATASEENNDYFQIERSQNGVKFEVLGKVKGAGTTVEPQTYSFVDATPKAGVNYYRLKQVDFDGAFEYSKIVAAGIKSTETDLLVYPSPASDILNISAPKAIEQVEVWDIAGRLLLTEARTGAVTTTTLDVATLASGTYFVKVQTSDFFYVNRFVKQ